MAVNLSSESRVISRLSSNIHYHHGMHLTKEESVFDHFAVVIKRKINKMLSSARLIKTWLPITNGKFKSEGNSLL